MTIAVAHCGKVHLIHARNMKFDRSVLCIVCQKYRKDSEWIHQGLQSYHYVRLLSTVEEVCNVSVPDVMKLNPKIMGDRKFRLSQKPSVIRY